MGIESNLTGNHVSLLHDDRGLTTVEYVILLVVIAIMSVTAWHKFGGSILGKLNQSQTTFDSEAVSTPPPSQ